MTHPYINALKKTYFIKEGSNPDIQVLVEISNKIGLLGMFHWNNDFIEEITFFSINGMHKIDSAEIVECDENCENATHLLKLIADPYSTQSNKVTLKDRFEFKKGSNIKLQVEIDFNTDKLSDGIEENLIPIRRGSILKRP